jgi:protein required for attachment to host cells
MIVRVLTFVEEIAMKLRIVVANESVALLYDLKDAGKGLQFSGQVSNPRARLHDRDLVSDRPGRRPDHAPLRSGRRGASPHHATAGAHEAHEHEVESFARQLAHELEAAGVAGQFEQLVIMAGPKFLGMLRALLPASVKSAIVAEVPKDLVNHPVHAIREHLPPPLYRLEQVV